MASSNRHWPSMFKSKACNTQHQWQHDINPTSLTSSGCHGTPHTSVPGECEERSPEPKPRWNPKPEQIRILEAIFNSGMVNPPREEIKKIRAQLQVFGQVGDANVFYWFQNRKSRSKNKQRQFQTTKSQPQPTPPITSNMSVPSCSSDKSSLKTTHKAFLNIGSPNVGEVPKSRSQSYFQTHSEVFPEPFFSSTAGGSATSGVFTEGYFCFPELSSVVDHVPDHDQTVGNCSGLLLSELMMSHGDTAKKVEYDEKMKLHEQLSLYTATTTASTITHTSVPSTINHSQGAGESGTVGPLNPAKSTVFINDVAFEVSVGPFNVREAFGDDAVLLHYSGQPVLTNQWGVTLHSLQHGAFYYLMQTLAPSPHDGNTRICCASLGLSSLISSIFRPFISPNDSVTAEFDGRLQLIKAVLISTQIYWSSIFILPKVVLNELNKIIRAFLWSGPEMKTTRAKVNWGKACRPKEMGGLDIPNLEISNKAGILRLIWDLHNDDGNRIWIRWCKAHLIKSKNFWTLKIPQPCSWSWRKILQLRVSARQIMKHKIDGGFNTDIKVDNFIFNSDWSFPLCMVSAIPELLSMSSPNSSRKDKIVWTASPSGTYNLKSTSAYLMGHHPSVLWHNLVWDNPVIPRMKFNLWLAVQSKLPTLDSKSMAQHENICVLCGTQPETHDHLFFNNQWKKKSAYNLLRKICLSSIVYHTWEERNERIFERKKTSQISVLVRICHTINSILKLGCLQKFHAANRIQCEWDLSHSSGHPPPRPPD
ncbi:uncharacterized protein LOC132277005 [Cornus florida]|uniref:uncharacterized protein LOC132277005 n=1 Tax=Cornus florida TaxID=4283 RepID=UPI002899BEE9|nr:uncharacterized protein LOC132277005 [Cornus florida]